MSFINEEKPTVSVKKKNLTPLIDYCIENKIDFTLTSRSAQSDDFDVEFIINNPKKAIALGMCLKELKLELNGLSVTPVAAIKASKKPAAASTKDAPANGQAIVAEGDVTLAFNDALQFDLGAAN
ncbi:MAG TPA: hypothetical protein PK289_05180 [Bacteroidia bacterium]|jgi:hypothetical protein|nr:hypothetical protein [Bacteroidia bacterium]HRG52535.1 hypothetical protein [Bacteroidia bacterium]